MRHIDEVGLCLFLIENKNEILEYVELKRFDSRKQQYSDFMDDFEMARKSFILTRTIEFLVFELNLDYDNVKDVVDYNFLRKVWDL